MILKSRREPRYILRNIILLPFIVLVRVFYRIDSIHTLTTLTLPPSISPAAVSMSVKRKSDRDLLNFSSAPRRPT